MTIIGSLASLLPLMSFCLAVDQYVIISSKGGKIEALVLYRTYFDQKMGGQPNPCLEEHRRSC